MAEGKSGNKQKRGERNVRKGKEATSLEGGN